MASDWWTAIVVLYLSPVPPSNEKSTNDLRGRFRHVYIAIILRRTSAFKRSVSRLDVNAHVSRPVFVCFHHCKMSTFYRIQLPLHH